MSAKWFNHCTTSSLVKPRDPFRVLRAFVAGAAATLVDLGTLTVLVAAFGLSPRQANVPALVAGGIVNFLGNRHFAFRATAGSIAKQAIGYGAVEIVALVLNGVLFDAAMRALPGHADWYVLLRLVTSHAVFLFFSYPLWRLVFRVPRPVMS